MNFYSSHFNEICESHKEEIKQLDIDTISKVLMCESLKLESEDQLLKFVNGLYSNNSKYSILYEYVDFLNVTGSSMSDFLSIFEVNDMTQMTWIGIQKRLKCEILNEGKKSRTRYKEKGKQFIYSESNEFKGIINYLQNLSSNKIDNEVKISASSCFKNEEKYQPCCVALFDDQNKIFASTNAQNSWLCFDFKERKVMPTNYTIRTNSGWFTSCQFLKSWIIECSNDSSSWDVIDDVKNCSLIKESNRFHTFNIQKKNLSFYRFIRIRMTGQNWNNDDYLIIDSFEIFGTLL